MNDIVEQRGEESRVPPRTRKTPMAQGPSTMKELKDTLWKAADKLRGSLSAAQYKDVILGLVFLKYVSDAYDERREVLRTEFGGDDADPVQLEMDLDDPDEYQGYGVFLVPDNAHWNYLSKYAKGRNEAGESPKSIGLLIDEAMDAVMAANESLLGTLPRIYNRDNIDQRRLGELVDLFNSAKFSRTGDQKARDLMGEVYEYFLGNFARAEGKRGGEFFTPPSVVRTIVEVLEPSRGRIYDPCCGSGGMFVQSEKFVEYHEGDTQDLAVYGQESIAETWRLAKMNLAIHGIDNKGLGATAGDTFARDQHPGIAMNYVMTNPPFNQKHWTRNIEDPRWIFGIPPANNANYAWIQHVLYKLKPNGSAGVVMANGSMSSNSRGEGDIRARIVEADLVSCMVAMPTQLFRSTGIPVCVWFFAKDKKAGRTGAVDRTGEVLFIDARDLGYMVDRAERTLSIGPDGDIAKIADTYHAWRGTKSAAAKGLMYKDVPGFCKSATVGEIKSAEYALTPGRYVGTTDSAVDSEPLHYKITRLSQELNSAMNESDAAGLRVRGILTALAHD